MRKASCGGKSFTQPVSWCLSALFAFGVVTVAPGLAVKTARAETHEDKPAFETEKKTEKLSDVSESVSFTAPPRTIRDITAILDQQKPDLAKSEAFRRKANRKPPGDVRGKDLVKFFYARGLAAAELGRTTQRLADLKRAVTLGLEHGGNLPRIYQQLALAERDAGNVLAASAAMENRMSRLKGKGQLFSSYRFLASNAATLGDFRTADRWLAKLEDLLYESRGWRQKSVVLYSSDWKSSVSRGKGHVIEARGKYPEAEKLYLDAYRKRLENIKKYADHKAYTSGNIAPIESYLWGRDILLRDIARVKARQGRLIEAEADARHALLNILKRKGKFSPETARGLRDFGNILLEQGRHEEAEKLARTGIDILNTTGVRESSLLSLEIRMLVADSVMAQERWSAAAEIYDQVERNLSGEAQTYRRRFGNNLNPLIAKIRTGKSSDILQAARLMLKQRGETYGGDNYLTAEARGILAVSLAKAGKTDTALAEFGRAVPVLVSASRVSDRQENASALRLQKLRLIFETYMQILNDIQGTPLAAKAGIDPVAVSFLVSDTVRDHSVRRALERSGARAAVKDPKLAAMVRREQNAEQQIGSLYGLLTNLLAASPEDRDDRLVADLRKRVDRLRAARKATRAEIDEAFPEYARLINPKPTTVDGARAALAAGEVLISTYAARNRTYVWAVPHLGPALFTGADIGREDLTDIVQSLRAALDPNAQTLGDIPEFDLAAAHGLYKALLGPLARGWKDSKSLLFVAHGPLGYLPISILPTEEFTLEVDKGPLFSDYRRVPWLALGHAVTVLPSVASLKTLRSVPAGKADRQTFVGFGDPWFNERQAEEAKTTPLTKVVAVQARGVLNTRGLPIRLRAAPDTQNVDSAELALLPRLSDTAEEVQSIGLAMNADPATSIFLGDQASEGRIKSMDLSGVRVLAFATHGLVPGDLNGLTEPALALSSPNVTGGDDDGLLTMSEILTLNLDADWVVLSACNTGSGEGAGAEAVSGLGRAFFYAGTRALLVSNWPVESVSARVLTTSLFRRQAEDAGLSRAEALRQSMVALIKGAGAVDPATGETIFSYAHPLFWAPFSLIGEGGT
jgi:CHAT domain-containing protein